MTMNNTDAITALRSVEWLSILWLYNYKNKLIRSHCASTAVFASPFDIGLDLLALSRIFISPTDTMNLSCTSELRCRESKKVMAIFKGINTTVKKIINLMYPTSYSDVLLTEEGFHFGPANIISQTKSNTMLTASRARVNRIYTLSKKFIK